MTKPRLIVVSAFLLASICNTAVPTPGVCETVQEEPHPLLGVQRSSLSNETVVANYRGHAIRYKDIRLPSKTEHPFHGTIELSPDELRRLERKRLVAKIRERAMSEALRKYDIESTGAEIDARRKELMRRAFGVTEFTQDMADVQNQRLDKMLKIAEMSRQNRSAAEKIYAEEMSALLSPEDWEHIKQVCATKEGFNKFKGQYKKIDVATMVRKYRELAVKQLQQEKVIAAESRDEGLSLPKAYKEWMDDKLKEANVEPVIDDVPTEAASVSPEGKQHGRIWAEPQPVVPPE